MANIEHLSGKPNNIRLVDPLTIIRRLIAKAVLDQALKLEIIDNGQNLPKADQTTAQGQGILLVWNHPSKRDGLAIGQGIVVGSPVLRRREMCYPIAWHQNELPVRIAAWLLDVRLQPLVTTHTRRLEEFTHLPLGEGSAQFLQAAAYSLQTGGITSVSFQDERQNNIYAPGGPVIGTLLRKLNREQIEDFSILLVGIAIKGKGCYDLREAGGYNSSHVYQLITVGYFDSPKHLLNHPEINGKFRNIDPFIRNQFALKLRSYTPDTYTTEPDKSMSRTLEK